MKKQEGEFCSKELGYIDTLLALKIYSQSHKQTSLTSWFGHNMLDLLIRLGTCTHADKHTHNGVYRVALQLKIYSSLNLYKGLIRV